MSAVRRLLESLRDITEADEDVRSVERAVVGNVHDGALQQKLISAYARAGLSQNEARAKAAVFYLTRCRVAPNERDRRASDPVPVTDPDAGWGDLAKRNLRWEGPQALARPWGDEIEPRVRQIVETGNKAGIQALGFVADSSGPKFEKGARLTRDVRYRLAVALPDKSTAIAYGLHNGTERDGTHYRKCYVALTSQAIVLHYQDVLGHPPAGAYPVEEDGELLDFSVYRHRGF